MDEPRDDDANLNMGGGCLVLWFVLMALVLSLIWLGVTDG